MKPCVFPCKVAAVGDETYLQCAAFFSRAVTVALLWVCLCVRSYRVFWNLWLQIAVEWLHDCCHVLLPRVCRDMRVCHEIGSSSVFCNEWLLLCA